MSARCAMCSAGRHWTIGADGTCGCCGRVVRRRRLPSMQTVSLWATLLALSVVWLLWGER